MARALALVAATPLRLPLHSQVRFVVVTGCALALILAEKALPAL